MTMPIRTTRNIGLYLSVSCCTWLLLVLMKRSAKLSVQRLRWVIWTNGSLDTYIKSTFSTVLLYSVSVFLGGGYGLFRAHRYFT